MNDYVKSRLMVEAIVARRALPQNGDDGMKERSGLEIFARELNALQGRHPDAWGELLPLCKRALKSMRQPTERMRAAGISAANGYLVKIDENCAWAIWQEMMDAAMVGEMAG